MFDPDLIAEIHEHFDAGLTELIGRVEARPGTELFVNKGSLDLVLTCEAAWDAPGDFEWNPATARGTVAHKAIEFSVHWRTDPVPMELVDAAIERLSDGDRSLGLWLSTIDTVNAADIRSRAVEHVTKFLECFPALDGRWNPVLEASSQYPVNGPIVLRARTDLVLGRPRGNESTKVIIDVKTGRLLPRHRQDLRFYALLETLSRRVPPRLLVTYSLDAGSPEVEDVTPSLLRSTLRRTLDAIERMVEMRAEDRDPTRTPNPTCRWCPLLPTCEPGQTSLGTSNDND
ncbi:hypothetical protein BH24ACT5_BH24ACT5_23700 [soil metagenome]